MLGSNRLLKVEFRVENKIQVSVSGLFASHMKIAFTSSARAVLIPN